MKVFFIFPNLNTVEGFNHGVADLSGGLKAHGHETKLLNINEHLYPIPTSAEILKLVRDYQPDVLCFSVMTQQYKYAVKISKMIREEFPSVPQVFGGVHASMVPEEVAKDGYFDYIGVGECDNALPELVDKMAEGKDTTNVRNIWAKKEGGEWVRNPVGPYPDLKIIAPKDYEIFDLEHMLVAKSHWLSILTSRGCPYRCTYCFNHEVTDRYREEGGFAPKDYLRHYPIETIIGEIEDLHKKYDPISMVIFDDDLFTLNKQYVIDFCRQYQKSFVKTPWVVNSHVQTFTRPVAQAMKDANCLIAKFGVESGSHRIRKEVLDRYMTNEKIIQAFDIAYEVGLHTSAFLMFGLPYETRKEIQETIDLIARIRAGRFRWSIFFPFPGTKSHKICIDGDMIDQDRMDNLDNYFDASCLKFDPDTDLFIRKCQKALSWYINAKSDMPTADFYAKKVEEIEKLNLKEWEKRALTIKDEDKEYSDRFLKEGKDHYALRYLDVMAVRSTWIKWEEDLEKEKPHAAREWRSIPAPAQA
ncbi:MAG: radical SAM protein [Planctomycetota bacterium]|nr:radical SAM protein [Planctomycetota bacterium]